MVVFGIFQKLFGNIHVAFGESSGSGWKSLENRQKMLSVCLYTCNKQNDTWLLVDMEYLFS